MASLANGMFLLCIWQLLSAVRAMNPIFFPCENNTDLTEVDCSHRGLTHVPSIHSSSVLFLNLDYNKIRWIKSNAFAGIPHLQTLTMSWNCLPDGLRGPIRPNITSCHMQIDPAAFVGLKNLKRLFLVGNSLSQVPALPTQLEVLGMEYNRLFNITEPLGTPRLKQLLLSKNCFYANPCNQTFFIHRRVFDGLPDLQNLTLGFNSITVVPPFLPRSLRSLDLRENKISMIDEQAFANLSELRSLNLEWNCQRCDHAAQTCFPCLNNASIKLHPKVFWQLEKITNLSLRGNSLKNIPDGLFTNLHNLNNLDLSDNLLAYAIKNGTFFKELKNVTTLNLLYNYKPLKTFPSLILSPHIGEMTSLEVLLLSGYFFRNLNSDGVKPLMNLKNLQILDLRMNFVSRCQISLFSKMKALKKVYLSQNMLDFTHDYYSNFCESDTPRQRMDNGITIAPELIRTGQNYLGSDEEDFLDPEKQTFYTRYCHGKLFFDLSQNNILYLKKEIFKGMEGVSCLDLSINYLSQTLNGEQFDNLKNLTYLNMSYNRIDMYNDKAFNEVKNTLKVLDLSYNAFHFYMKGMGHRFEFIRNLTSLEVLSLAENNIGIRISTKLHSTSLNYLFFAGNRLDIMWDNSYMGQRYINFFTELTNLTYLDISRNKLKFLSPEALNNLPKSLKTLRVSGNDLNYFPWYNLMNLSNLCYLDLSGNSLTQLVQGTINFSANLTTLDLSHNRISQLPESFFQKATSLRSLLLNNNQLKQLWMQGPPFPLRTNLEHLTLHDNPFVCSCDTAWLSDFLKTTPIEIPHLTTNVKCGFPESQQGESVFSMDPRSCQEIFGSIGFLCTCFLTVVLTVVPLLQKLYGWDLWYCVHVFWAGHKGYSLLQDDSSQHDAFIVFDTRNVAVRDWVYNELVVNLEGRGRRRFRLCLEERDWVPGIACIENLYNAVHNSRKTVFVLTNSGSVSGILKQAFYMTQQRLLDEKVDAVVLVLLDKVFPKLKYLQMRKRLCRKSVLSWPRNPHAHQHFWNKMRIALVADNSHSYDKNVNESFLANDLL